MEHWTGKHYCVVWQVVSGRVSSSLELSEELRGSKTLLPLAPPPLPSLPCHPAHGLLKCTPLCQFEEILGVKLPSVAAGAEALGWKMCHQLIARHTPNSGNTGNCGNFGNTLAKIAQQLCFRFFHIDCTSSLQLIAHCSKLLWTSFTLSSPAFFYLGNSLCASFQLFCFCCIFSLLEMIFNGKKYFGCLLIFV